MPKLPQVDFVLLAPITGRQEEGALASFNSYLAGICLPQHTHTHTHTYAHARTHALGLLICSPTPCSISTHQHIHVTHTHTLSHTLTHTQMNPIQAPCAVNKHVAAL